MVIERLKDMHAQIKEIYPRLIKILCKVNDSKIRGTYSNYEGKIHQGD